MRPYKVNFEISAAHELSAAGFAELHSPVRSECGMALYGRILAAFKCKFRIFFSLVCQIFKVTLRMCKLRFMYVSCRAVTTIFILGGLRSHYRRRPHYGWGGGAEKFILTGNYWGGSSPPCPPRGYGTVMICICCILVFASANTFLFMKMLDFSEND